MDMDPRFNSDQCGASLETAHDLLKVGCQGLLEATGIDLSPDYLAHALLVPLLATDVSSRIDAACREITDPAQMARARDAIESIIASTKSLRAAIDLIAEIQSSHAKAISAYHENL